MSGVFRSAIVVHWNPHLPLLDTHPGGDVRCLLRGDVLLRWHTAELPMVLVHTVAHSPMESQIGLVAKSVHGIDPRRSFVAALSTDTAAVCSNGLIVAQLAALGRWQLCIAFAPGFSVCRARDIHHLDLGGARTAVSQHGQDGGITELPWSRCRTNVCIGSYPRAVSG